MALSLRDPSLSRYFSNVQLFPFSEYYHIVASFVDCGYTEQVFYSVRLENSSQTFDYQIRDGSEPLVCTKNPKIPHLRHIRMTCRSPAGLRVRTRRSGQS